jgi:SAM-dependent methyltransferase
MELKIGIQNLALAIGARARLSSDEVFGAESLVPAGPVETAPETAACHPRVGEEELQLLREAYGRLLGEGDFPQVLDLLGGSDRFTSPDAVGSLTSPAPSAPTTGSHRRLMLQIADELNEQPGLPFEDESFDAVLVTLDVGALRQPLEVFREVGRVLRPAGLVAVSFGAGGHDEAHTRLWALAGGRERLMLAEAFIEFAAAGFTAPVSMTFFHGEAAGQAGDAGDVAGEAARAAGGDQAGRQVLEWREGRAPLDHPELPHAHVVFAYRDAVAPPHLEHPPFPPPAPQPAKTKDDIRYDEQGRPRCPYCGAAMGRYAPPVTVFEIDYGVDELYVCFEDGCGYYRRSRRWMRSQGHPGFTYRFMFDPATGATGPLPDDLWGGLRSCRVD